MTAATSSTDSAVSMVCRPAARDLLASSMLIDKSMPYETEGEVVTPILIMAKMEKERRMKDEEPLPMKVLLRVIGRT
jgi:hypothetical protein